MSRDFDGTTQYASRSDGCGISAYPCTVAFWFNPATLSTTDFLFSFANTDNNPRQVIFVNASGSVTLSNQDDEEATPSNTISTSSWHHIAIILSSSTSRRCVVNGDWTNSATNTTSVTFPGSPVQTRIAADFYTDNGADGQFAHAAVWSVALSQSEVEGLAGGDNPLAVQNSSLVAYWPLAGTSTPEPDDKNSYDLTLTGSPPAGGSDPTVDGPPGGASVYAFQ